MNLLEPWTGTSPQNLPRLFMACYCVTLVVQLLRSAPAMLGHVREDPGDRREPMRFFGLLPIPHLSLNAYVVAFAGLAVTLCVAAAGVQTRITLLCALALYPLVFGPVRPLSFVMRKTHSVPLILIILAGADGIDAPFDTAVPRHSLTAVALLIGLIYFASFVEKMRSAGPRWADGRTLQSHLVAHHLWGEMPRALWLARRPGLCRALATATLLLEATFPLAALVPATRWLLVPAGLGFHLGTRVFMRIDYLRFLGPAYLVFFARPLFDLGRSLGLL